MEMTRNKRNKTMKITIIPTATTITHYQFNGETITAFCNGEQEDFDLSSLVAGAEFQSVVVDTLEANTRQVIREAYRGDDGELHVTLCQGVGAGHWETSDVIDSSDYDPDKVYVKLNEDKSFGGTAKVTTRKGVL
jgi:hypothetical protein